MTLIPYPDVPDDDGVPAVPRDGYFIASPVYLGATSTALVNALQQTPQWGIYAASTSSTTGAQLGATSSNANILSIGSVDFIKEMQVSDFPVEDGGFASYNKVEKAATPTVVLILGGSSADRQALISTIDAAVKSTNVYNVVTPDYTLTNCTLGKWSLRRAPERGANLVAISISLVEIRQVSASYSNSKQVSSGRIQSKTPSPATTKTVTNNLYSVTDPYGIMAFQNGGK